MRPGHDEQIPYQPSTPIEKRNRNTQGPYKARAIYPFLSSIFSHCRKKGKTSKLMVAQFLLSESNQLYQVKVVEQSKSLRRHG